MIKSLINRTIDMGIAYVLQSFSFKRKVRVFFNELLYNQRLLEQIKNEKIHLDRAILYVPFQYDIYRYLVTTDFNFKKVAKKLQLEDFTADIHNLYIKMQLCSSYWKMQKEDKGNPLLKTINFKMRLNNIRDDLLKINTYVHAYIKK